MAAIRVSYILTTRNRARFLDEALRNAKEYVTRDDELIVVDGGSTDNTLEIAEKHRDVITFFRSEPDCGEAHGFNKGILESRGRFIKVVTDDDYFYPEAMRRAIDELERHPQVDALLCGGEEYRLDAANDEPRLVRYQHLPESRGLVDDRDNILRYVTCGIGLVLTRRVIARVGLFDTSFHAVDLDYLARLMASGVEFKYLDIKLWRHLHHPGSGEKDIDKCAWDSIRIFLRERAWEAVISRHAPADIDKVLGLDVVSEGSWLGLMVREGNWMRLNAPMLLRLIAASVNRFHRCRIWVERSLRPAEKSTTYPATPTLIEPDWDGSLR